MTSDAPLLEFLPTQFATVTNRKLWDKGIIQGLGKRSFYMWLNFVFNR